MNHSDETPRDQRLQRLLALKRHERPQPGFWDGFDADLKRAILRSVMEEAPPQPLRVRVFQGLQAAAPVALLFAMLGMVVLGQIRMTPNTPTHMAQWETRIPAPQPQAVSSVSDEAPLSASDEPTEYLVDALTLSGAPNQPEPVTIPARHQMAAVHFGRLDFTRPAIMPTAQSGPNPSGY